MKKPLPVGKSDFRKFRKGNHDMRTFSSYGPIDKDIHYHVPRKELIDNAYLQLIGEKPEKGGHFITIWAPRQAGKTWIMQQVVRKIRGQGDFEVAIISMQSAKTVKTDEGVLNFSKPGANPVWSAGSGSFLRKGATGKKSGRSPWRISTTRS